MGYYSEVGVCFTEKAHNLFLSRIEELGEELKNEVNKLLSEAEKHTKDKDTLYHWRWIKWYENYSDVGFVARFLEELSNNEDSDLDYYIVTIGEDIGDIEEEGNYYDNSFALCSVQSVSYDLPNQ